MDNRRLLARLARIEGPLGVLLCLFHARIELDLERVEATLGPIPLRAMEATRLVVRRGSRVAPLVRLAPVGDLVFASDPAHRHDARQADFVLGAGGVTRRLADFAPGREVDSVLDLGCGAGILAGLAAEHARRVVATDINSRAVAFSRFNAELNGLTHMECRRGSLFEPVAGQRFDLILCNPPYVISPTSTFVYRDGGTALCRRIVQEAAQHLTPSGLLEMLVEWPEREGSDWRSEVRDWLEGAGCDAWLLRLYSHAADSYATGWLAQDFRGADIPEAAHAEWVEHLRRRGIEAVGGGLLLLRPAAGSTPHTVLRDAPRVMEPAGPTLHRWLAGQMLLSRLGHDGELLDTVLAPAPGLERTERRTATGEGWTTGAIELRLLSGLTFAAGVDPVAADIVGLLDGRRSPREALAVFAGNHGVSPSPFVGGLPAVLRRLVALGILVPSPGHPA